MDKLKNICYRFMYRLGNGKFKSPYFKLEYDIVNDEIEDQRGFFVYTTPLLPMFSYSDRDDVECFVLLCKDAISVRSNETVIWKAKIIFHGSVKELLKMDLNVLKSKMLKYGIVEKQISASISDIERCAIALGYR